MKGLVEEVDLHSDSLYSQCGQFSCKQMLPNSSVMPRRWAPIALLQIGIYACVMGVVEIRQ